MGKLTATQNVAIVASALTFGSGSISNQSFVAQLGITPIQLPPATGGTSPRSYSLAAVNATGSNGTLQGGLPQGLSFNSASTSRQLQGTPSAAAVGVYDMTYKATDSTMPPAAEDELTFTLTITANQPPVFSQAAIDTVMAADTDYTENTAITPLVLPTAMGGEAGLSYSLTAVSDKSISANLSGGLPKGLSYNTGTRTLSGTPTAVDTYTLTYKAVDGDSNTVDCIGANNPAGCDTASIVFKVEVVEQTFALALSGGDVTAGGTILLNTGTADVELQMPTASGGTIPYTDTLTGTFDPDGAGGDEPLAISIGNTGKILQPDGMTESGLSFTDITPGAPAEITGTPKVSGSYVLTYAVTDDAVPVATQSVTFTLEAGSSQPPSVKAACDTRDLAGKSGLKRVIEVPYEQHLTNPQIGTVDLDLHDCFTNIGEDTVFLVNTNYGSLGKAVNAYLPTNVTGSGEADTLAPTTSRPDGLTPITIFFSIGNKQTKFKFTDIANKGANIVLRTDQALNSAAPVVTISDTLTIQATNSGGTASVELELRPAIERSFLDGTVSVTTPWTTTDPRIATLLSALSIGNNSAVAPQFSIDFCIDKDNSCDPTFELPTQPGDTGLNYPQALGKTETVKKDVESSLTQLLYSITPEVARGAPVYLRFQVDYLGAPGVAYIIDNGVPRLWEGTDFATQTLSLAIGAAADPTAAIGINGAAGSAGSPARVPYTETVAGTTDTIALSSSQSQGIGSGAEYCWTLDNVAAGTLTDAELGTLSGNSSASCASTDADTDYTPYNMTSDLTVAVQLTITPAGKLRPQRPGI